MTNFVFACGSVNGLTLQQKRETVKALRASIAEEVLQRKHAKSVAAEEKAEARLAKAEAQALKREQVARKRMDAIAKAQARLDKLLSKQVGHVGHKAAKANRRASKVVTYGAEANAIAEKIKANRVQKELF
jgi:hypothetical protein